MKNNQTALVLVGLMLIMSLGTAWLLWRYNKAAHRIQELNVNVQLWKNTQNLSQVLLNQVAEYSKKDPAVLPILQWATNNTPATTAPGPTPAKSAPK